MSPNINKMRQHPLQRVTTTSSQSQPLSAPQQQRRQAVQSIFQHKAESIRQQQRDKRKHLTTTTNSTTNWTDTPSNIELQRMGLRPINHQSPSKPPAQKQCRQLTPEKVAASHKANSSNVTHTNPQNGDDDECIPSEDDYSSSSDDSDDNNKPTLTRKRERSNQNHEQNFPDSLAEAQSKYKRLCKGLTFPRNRALLHPAASLLTEYATQGCPADCGEDWTIEMMEAAIARGPHPSAANPQAAEYCWLEAKEKEKAGQVRLIKWSTLKKAPPSKLKMSPVATVPHKSRAF